MARRTFVSTSVVHDDDIDDFIDVASDASSDNSDNGNDNGNGSDFGLSMAANTLLVSEDEEEEDDKIGSLRVRTEQQEVEEDDDVCGSNSLLDDRSGLLGVPVTVTSSLLEEENDYETQQSQSTATAVAVVSPVAVAAASPVVAAVSPSGKARSSWSERNATNRGSNSNGNSNDNSHHPSSSSSLSPPPRSATTRASAIRQQRQRSSALSLLQKERPSSVNKAVNGNGNGNVAVVSPVPQPKPQQQRSHRDYYPTATTTTTKITPAAPVVVKTALSTISGTSTQTEVSRGSNASNRVPQDVRIVVGPDMQQQEFYHSSHILSYASPVLAAALSSTSDTAVDHDPQQQQHNMDLYKFTLTLPHKLPHEWKLLQPFLEPHSVTSAHVTAEPLPILLAWFQELQLHVLLRDADVILKSLLSAWPDCSTAEPPDLQDLLLLVQIADRATLPHTWTASMETMDRYLTVRPDLLLLGGSNGSSSTKGKSKRGSKAATNHSSSLRLTTSLEVVQELALVLRESPVAREHLWTSVCMYLPPDLAVYSEIAALTENPLFGYLLREGLEKAVASGGAATAGSSSHNNTSFHSHGSSTRNPPSADQSSQSSSSDGSIEYKIDRHLRSEHDDSWQGDLQRDFDRWWNTWNNQSQSKDRNQGRGGSGRNFSTHGSSKTSNNANGSGQRAGISHTLSSSSFRDSGYQGTMDRTAWLEEILRKLKDAEPAITAAANLTRGKGDGNGGGSRLASDGPNATPPAVSPYPSIPQPYCYHAAASAGFSTAAAHNHYTHVGSNIAEHSRYTSRSVNSNSADGSSHFEQPTVSSSTSSAAVLASTASSSMPPRPVRRTFAC